VGPVKIIFVEKTALFFFKDFRADLITNPVVTYVSQKSSQAERQKQAQKIEVPDSRHRPGRKQQGITGENGVITKPVSAKMTKRSEDKSTAELIDKLANIAINMDEDIK